MKIYQQRHILTWSKATEHHLQKLLTLLKNFVKSYHSGTTMYVYFIIMLLTKDSLTILQFLDCYFRIILLCFQKIKAISSRLESDNNLLRAITYLQIENILIKQLYFIAMELEEFCQLDHFFKVIKPHEKSKRYSFTVIRK